MICHIIPSVLDALPRDENGVCPIKVGFLTYGHTISFFNLAPELTKPQMMVSHTMSHHDESLFYF